MTTEQFNNSNAAAELYNVVSLLAVCSSEELSKTVYIEDSDSEMTVEEILRSVQRAYNEILESHGITPPKLG